MLVRTLSLNFCVMLALIANASPLHATDHAVTVTVRSADELKALALQFPTRLTSELQFSLKSIAGPVLDLASSDSPIVVYLDWYTDLPDPIVCMKNYRKDSLRALQELSQDKMVTLESGIMQIKAAAPIYLKEELGWLYIGTTEDSLRNLQAPTLTSLEREDAPLQAEINLRMIPSGTRTEIANTIARRLLPTAISTVDEFSAEQLLQIYTKRLLTSFADQAERIHLDARAGESGPQLGLRVDGRQLQPLVAKASRLPLMGLDEHVPTFAFHSSLNDEEVAYLTWWAQGLPDRTLASFQDSQIEDRSGEAGLQQLATAGAMLLRSMAQSGNLEGMAAFTGEKRDIPLLGFAVPNAKAVRAQLEQLAASPSMKDLGLTSVELDVDSTNELQIHRFTFGGIEDEPFPMWIALSEHAAFLMVDANSVAELKSWFEHAADDESPATPLQLTWPNFSLASYFGVEGSEEEATGTLNLSSRYTETGMDFQLKLNAGL